jgi:hypothetical protein
MDDKSSNSKRSPNVSREEHGWIVDFLVLNPEMLKVLNGNSTGNVILSNIIINLILLYIRRHEYCDCRQAIEEISSILVFVYSMNDF